MRINLTHVIEGVGVGAVDEFLERNDAANGRTEITKKWSTWERAALVGLGYLGQAMDIMPGDASAIAQSALPLLTKSALEVVWKQGVAGRATNRFSEVLHNPGGRVKRSYQQEFSGTSLT